MDQNTLKERRKKIYILLKIIKHLTDSPTKSYDAKYAVEMTFHHNKEPSEIYGNALAEVMNHRMIRGLYDLNNVHPDLRKLGVTGIVLHDNTVEFKGNKH